MIILKKLVEDIFNGQAKQEAVLNKKLLILLSGKRCSGKDFLCNVIIEELNKYQTKSKKSNIKAQVLAHADQMKVIYCERTGADLSRMINDREYKEKNRSKMTEMYQDICKRRQENIFVDKIISQIQKTDANVIIISDFRRKMEDEAYKKYFAGRVIEIRVTCENQTREKRGWKYDPQIDENITETELDSKNDWEYVFKNEGSKEDAQIWASDLILNSEKLYQL